MENSTHRASNSALGWITLIIAVLALVLAWSAYNRAGVDLEDQIEAQADEATRDATGDALEGGADALDRGAADARSDDDGTNN